MDPLNQFILFLVSLVANIFSAFSGGGAGLIQLPVVIFFGLTFSVALATHKVASVALGVGATIRHWKESHLQRQFAVFILATGLPGVFIGANLIVGVKGSHAEIALGVLTASLGIYSFFKESLGQNYQPKNQNRRGYLMGGAGIFFVGILNGSLTSGTGLFVTLLLVSWFGLDYKRAVAYTLILVGLFWNGLGAVTLGFLSHIEWSWLPALLLGSLIGGYIGAHLSIVAGNKFIKRGFEIVTVLIGAQLILRNIFEADSAINLT